MTKRKRREDKLSQKEKLEDFMKFLESLCSDDLKAKWVIDAATAYTQHLSGINAILSPMVTARSPAGAVSAKEMGYSVEPEELRRGLLEAQQQVDSKTAPQESESLDELSDIPLITAFNTIIASVADQSMPPGMPTVDKADADKADEEALRAFYAVETRYGNRYLGQRLRGFLEELSALDNTEDHVKNLITEKIAEVQKKIKNQEKIESDKENLKTIAGKKEAVAVMNAQLGYDDDPSDGALSLARPDQPQEMGADWLQKKYSGLFQPSDDSGESLQGGKKRKGANPNAKPLFDEGYSSDGSEIPSPG